jgi:hypothetical protein
VRPCPVTEQLQQLEVGHIDVAGLCYLPDPALKAMAAAERVFKTELIAYHVVHDFDTEELLGGQVGLSEGGAGQT